MSEQKLITAEEYAAAIRLAEAEIACGGDLAMDSAARVLLALDGAWREVRHRFVSDEVGNDLAARHGLPVEGDRVAEVSKTIEGDESCPVCKGFYMATGSLCKHCRGGLPPVAGDPCPDCGGTRFVYKGPSGDRIEPCPECGGYEVVANGEYFTKPCPTCQGGR